MKKAVNLILAILSPLASVPTGWAIYAGATKQPAFPMNPAAAIIGAVAIIATSIAAGLLVVDVYAYNQGMKNKTEREELSMSPFPAWAVMGLCVVAEIALSLLVVVIPGALPFGVLVFPMMTAAGVFAFAIRYDLQQREQGREQLRASKPKAVRKAKRLAETLPQAPQVPGKPLQKLSRKPVTDNDLLAYLAANPGASQQQVADNFQVSRQAIGQRVKKLYEVKQ